MNDWNVIILGLVQGLTEFLPVSSSGHLILAPALLGFQDQGLAMDAMLHMGTLLSIFIFFRKDLWGLFLGLLPGSRGDKNRVLAWSIIAASFPAGIFGLAADDWIEANLRSPLFVAGSLFVWSIVFWFIDKRGKQREGISDVHQLSPKRVFFIGCAQALALVPGTSRSGVTLAAGLLTNLNHQSAARFSFLLGAPIITAAGSLKTFEFFFDSGPKEFLFSTYQLFLGFSASFIVGYFAIHLLLKIVARVGLTPFIYYRVLLAGFIGVYFW